MSAKAVFTLALALTAPQAVPAPSPIPEVRPVNPIMQLTYDEAAALAVREKRPLFVWVGYSCPSSAFQLPEAVHTFTEEFFGDRKQRVIASVPNSRGWLDYAGEVSAADCCASNLRAVVNQVTMKSQVTTDSVWNHSATQSRFFRVAHGNCAT